MVTAAEFKFNNKMSFDDSDYKIEDIVDLPKVSSDVKTESSSIKYCELTGKINVNEFGQNLNDALTIKQEYEGTDFKVNKELLHSVCDLPPLKREDTEIADEDLHQRRKKQKFGTIVKTTEVAVISDVTVQYLKTIKFNSLTIEQQIKIKSVGRPKPSLEITKISKGKNRDYKRSFKIDIYEKTDWLCGCNLTNSLYCFPCLLFSDESSEWTKTGVTDLVHLSEKLKKHQSSKAHISAKLGFNLLGKQDIRQQLNSKYRLSIEKHNEEVKKNRYVLSKIIDCIKFCGAFELVLRGDDEQENSINPGGLINFSAELDLALKHHLQQATMFKNTSSKDIQNDLLECMLNVCRSYIKKEISDSNFVSVISDETSDISNIFQLVIVYRYTLGNGTPVERFWTFLKPNNHDAVCLAGCIEESLNCVLKNSDQLISQSYHGASIMSGGVQKIIKDKFQYADYIHSYAHQFNLFMTQATTINRNVRIFFSDLSDVTNFFSNSPERLTILDEVVKNSVGIRWNFKNRIVNTVYEYRDDLINCLETIQSTSIQSDTLRKAGGLLRLLNDRKFIFWLTVFYRIMPHINILYSQLKKTTIDSLAIKRCISEFERSIQKERDNMYTIRESQLVDIEEIQFRKKRKIDDTTFYVSTTVQAKEVCDTIISETKRSFLFTGHLEIANLFAVELFEEYSSNFPIIQLETTIRRFPFLNKNKLRTELEIIYKRSDFRVVSGSVHLLKFLIENNLQTDFSETFLVLQAIVTMPMTTSEPERCFSTLKRIKNFLRNTICQDRLTALAMLSIEKQMIQEIPSFNELVVDEFIKKKDRQIHFQYKTCL